MSQHLCTAHRIIPVLLIRTLRVRKTKQPAQDCTQGTSRIKIQTAKRIIGRATAWEKALTIPISDKGTGSSELLKLSNKKTI